MFVRACAISTNVLYETEGGYDNNSPPTIPVWLSYPHLAFSSSSLSLSISLTIPQVPHRSNLCGSLWGKSGGHRSGLY